MTDLAKDPPKSDRYAVPFMIGASAFVAGTSLIAKALGLDTVDADGLHLFHGSAGRFGFAFAALFLFLTLMPKSRPTLRGARWDWHLMRSLCGWLGVSAMFAAVAKMPVAEATAISFLSPLVTMGLAVLMLGERMGLRKYIAVTFALGGALMILKPGTDAFQTAGLFALASAAFLGLEAIFIKRLSDSEPALRVLLFNNTIGAIVSLVVASTVWAWPTPDQWFLLMALGVVMLTAQSMFIQAMKRGAASFVLPALYSVLAFAAIYDFLFYSVMPGLTGFLGATLILSGALVLARQRNSEG